MTGLWQVSGRSETTFQHRSELDAIYLQAWNARRDLVLMLRTFDVVLRQRGAY
jgi:undecaprenyl-phosphate galactose phosphotransferase